MSRIRILPDHLINRIAAGEVVERPASIVKELIENALDASATRIDIAIENAGCTMISVTDDGCGMSLEDLKIAIERHATSKLTEDNLEAIQTFGFRGEALPSMASVSRLRLMSRDAASQHGWCVHIDHGILVESAPMALNIGTCVEVTELFARVPARLKFLKTERTERTWILETVERLSLAHPRVHWSLRDSGRMCLDLPALSASDHPALLARLARVIDADAAEHLIAIQDCDSISGLEVTGYISLPTYHKGQSQQIYAYVNDRFIKDKTLIQAIRIGYQDVLAHDRYPVVLLMLRVPYSQVDVNVHPAKTEVRFQNPQDIRRAIIRAIRQALEREGQRSAGILKTASMILSSPNKSVLSPADVMLAPLPHVHTHYVHEQAQLQPYRSLRSTHQHSVQHQTFLFQKNDDQNTSPPPLSYLDYPLGEARAQIQQTYIVAETQKGLIFVDQHAAHERIVYEQLKNNHIPSRQVLMIPEVVTLRPLAYDALMLFQDECAERGLMFESFGPSTVLVRELPSVISTCHASALILEMAESALEHQGIENMEQKIHHLYATIACHHSLRAGHTLTIPEMNALLRKMEETLMTGQCNHGRPTYIQWTHEEIRKSFERS